MLEKRFQDNIVIAEFCNGKFDAITRETLENLDDCIQTVNNDDSVKVLILTGAGRTFSSGFDLRMFLGFKNLDNDFPV